MPYMIVERDGEYCVYKRGDDGPEGESLGCHAARDGAVEQIAAIEEGEEKAVNALREAVEDALKQVDAQGRRLMLIVTSNAYKDREQEIIKEAALKELVESYWDGDTFKGLVPHLWWHGGDPLGEIVFSDMEGPFLIEVSREGVPGAINLADDGEDPFVVERSEVWDAMEKAEDLGASHRFAFVPGDEEDGVYEQIVKLESTTLPKVAAANPYTLSVIIREDMKMDKFEFLKKLGIEPKTAGEIVEGAQEAERILDEQGVERKDLDTEKAMSPAAVMEMVQEQLTGQAGEDGMVSLSDVQSVLAEILAESEEDGMYAEEEERGAEKSVDTGDAEVVEALKSYIVQTTEDVGQIAREYAAQKQLVADMAEVIKAQDKRIAELEKAYSMRPRRASQSPLTALEAPAGDAKAEKAIAAVRESIEKGTKGEKFELGLRVKE